MFLTASPSCAKRSSSSSACYYWSNCTFFIVFLFLIISSCPFKVSALAHPGPWFLTTTTTTSFVSSSSSTIVAAAAAASSASTTTLSGTSTTTTATTDSSSLESRSDNNEMSGACPRHVKVLGVCGGIGSGKSAACKMLVSEFGCIAHLEADTMAHSVYEPGSQAIQEIVQAFGSDVLDDEKTAEDKAATIDRAKLGSIVFADRSKMQQLERIVWPHVKDLILQRIQEIDEQYGKDLEKDEAKDNNSDEKKRPVVIVEAAVLLDAGWDDMMKKRKDGGTGGGGAGVWVVRASLPVARQRLIDQRGYTEEVADKRIQAQQKESRRGIGPDNLQIELDRGEDDAVVTQVIDNDGDLDDLRRALSQALASIS